MTKLNLTTLNDEQKEAFVSGWKNAGGYMGDENSDGPWCAPWYWRKEIDVEGESFEAMGADWWNQCKEEIESSLAEESDLSE